MINKNIIKKILDCLTKISTGIVFIIASFYYLKSYPYSDTKCFELNGAKPIQKEYDPNLVEAITTDPSVDAYFNNIITPNWFKYKPLIKSNFPIKYITQQSAADNDINSSTFREASLAISRNQPSLISNDNFQTSALFIKLSPLQLDEIKRATTNILVRSTTVLAYFDFVGGHNIGPLNNKHFRYWNNRKEEIFFENNFCDIEIKYELSSIKPYIILEFVILVAVWAGLNSLRELIVFGFNLDIQNEKK